MEENKFGFIGIIVAAAFIIAIPLQSVYADESSGTTSTASSTSPTATSTDSTTASSTDPDITIPPFSLDTIQSLSTSTSPNDTASSTASSTTPDDVGTTTPPSTSPSGTSTSTSPTTGTAHLLVRDGSTIAFNGTLTFPIGTSTTSVLPTNSSTTVPVASESLLGALIQLESSESTFSISDLEYYASYGEFYINCITIPGDLNSPLCGDWQYEVDGMYPQEGADQYTLQNGDSVNLYFGTPREVSLSTTTIAAGQSITATAQSYDPTTDTFSPITGYTIGVTQPNPSDPYSPTEIATSTVDANGQATFTLNTPGSYGVGLEEDYYSFLTPLTVLPVSTSTTATSTTGGGTGGSGGGGGGTDSSPTASAFSYLAAQQLPGGSFDTPLITDWAAIALSLPDAPQSARAQIKAYLESTPQTLSLVTDYERHAMALMSLGLNPYTTAGDDITPIVNSFNGTEIGDPTLDNGDIFALIVLPKAGYTSSDTIIQKTAAFVVSRQESDGSWDESSDLTAAGIQALTPLASLPGVETAIENAQGYLHKQQQSDGGFGNSYSTSWVLGAIASLGQSPSSWSVGAGTPLTSLESLQQSDGGFNLPSTGTDNRVWATAYALSAIEGRSWNSLLSGFPLPAGVYASTSDLTGTDLASTTTLVTATSTTLTASSTEASTTPIVVPPLVPVITPFVGTVTRTKTATTESNPNLAALRSTNTSGTTSTDVSNQLAAAGASSGGESFWGYIVNFFGWVGSLLGHLF